MIGKGASVADERRRVVALVALEFPSGLDVVVDLEVAASGERAVGPGEIDVDAAVVPDRSGCNAFELLVFGLDFGKVGHLRSPAPDSPRRGINVLLMSLCLTNQ